MKFLYLYFFVMLPLFMFTQGDYKDHIKQTISVLENANSSAHFNGLIQEELLENVFPFWYGTPWDYNGYTNIPRKGEIACGYFVSTCLKHIGFNLNRYDIAKMYSSDIVRVLCTDDYLVLNDWDSFLEKIERMPKGIYILGLSNHVGFISIEDEGAYFIHSNYVGSDGVEKEQVVQSDALQNTKVFWLGNFSTNLGTYSKYKGNKVFEKH